ncbi:MAG: PUA domain-containing protein [Candidatus Bathyarchaeota archaeon]
MEKDTSRLNRIRGIANYQFTENIGRVFFPRKVEISLSKRTGRIRHIYLNGVLIATLRPTDGLFSLTIDGAQRLRSLIKPSGLRVVVQGDVEKFAKEGKNIFARHVINADVEIRPGEEVIVTNEKDEVLAVGRALLTGKEMPSFKRGVAVKTRRGVDETKR